MYIVTNQLTISLLQNVVEVPVLLGVEKWKVVGFYSICSDLPNRTLFHDEALIYKKTADFIYGNKYDRNGVWKKMFGSLFEDFNINRTFEHVPFDICSKDDLVRKVLDILLNETFYVNNKTQNPPLFNGQIIQNWEQQTNVLFIAAFLPEHMVKILVETTMAFMIPIVVLNEVNLVFNEDFDHIRFKVPLTSDADILYDFLINDLQTTDTVVILLKENFLSTNEKICNWLVKFLKKEKTCISFVSVESGNNKCYQNIVDNLRLDDQDRAISLFGNQHEQEKLLNMAMKQGLDHRIWVAHYVDNIYLDFMLPNTTIYSPWDLEYWLCSHISIHSKLYPSTLFLHSNVSNDVDWTYSDALCQFESLFEIYFDPWKYDNSTDYNRMKSSFLYDFRRSIYLYQHEMHDGKMSFIPVNFDEVETLEKHCKIQLCPPGWEKHYGKLLDNQTMWDASYGWTCRRCERDYFKSNTGDGPCQMCEGFNISNDDRTKCFDPFIARSVDFHMLSAKVAMSLSIFGTVGHITFLCLFLKYRNTPVILSGDAKFTVLHTISCIAIDIALPLLFLANPSYVICICRPTVISVLFTISLSIVVVKSYKMHRIFSSKVIMTRTEVLMTSIAPWFAILVLVLFGLVILIVTFANIPAKVLVSLRYEILTEDIYCNTGFHIQCQVAYFILLLMFCAVQAFRARKLPVMFNDATSTAYASFTLTILFTTLFPIYYFQNNKHGESIVIWIELSVSNVLLFLIMYGERVRIILFKPHKNTKAFLNSQIMQNINTDVSTAYNTRQAEISL